MKGPLLSKPTRQYTRGRNELCKTFVSHLVISCGAVWYSSQWEDIDPVESEENLEEHFILQKKCPFGHFSTKHGKRKLLISPVETDNKHIVSIFTIL